MLLQFYIRIYVYEMHSIWILYLCACVGFYFKEKQKLEKNLKKKENFENEKKHGIYSKH